MSKRPSTKANRLRYRPYRPT